MEAPSANEPSNNKNNTEGNSSKPSYSEVCLEEQTVVLLPDSSKTALVSPHKTNKTTTDLEKSSQESRVCSTVSLCKKNKTPRPARYRLPKPKPNLNSGLVSTRNVSQKPLNLSSDMEECKEIQNDDKMSEKPREEQKVEMNLQMDEQLAKISTLGLYDLHSVNAGPTMQENNMESGNPIQEICEIASELTSPKRSQETAACLSEPPDKLNIKSNIYAFESAEHQFSTAEVAQTEGNKNDTISAMTEMSAVRSDITDFVDAEEEPGFILTLVEITPDSMEYNGVPAVLSHGSGELLPPPILFTSDNMDSLELRRDER
ncbi:PREDICTED: uncharacterized protein LOC106546509 isoform X2 [Thamnophis sirtalis]|uniref:Uncharacterized protein LOC106546509 isoform X2 n=1 Tax=Thamnophis sirtalis TaxID=35019 RepID=A0A6I9XXG6_9SAUR|nr:PREDICTED: uncharacterized protein LOC106546509 isoform X2 [Thamnophis sirtalis]